MQGSIPNVVAGCLALTAFLIAILAGLVQSNPAMSVLGRAVTAMIVCYPVGLAAGYVCLRALERDVRTYAAAHPTPTLDDLDQDSERIEEATEVSADDPLGAAMSNAVS